jgi:hypothetical protein
MAWQQPKTSLTLLAVFLAVIAALLGVGTTAAAPPTTQSITFAFTNATFNSILGGSITGSGSLAGTISTDGTQLSPLKGTLNFPLKNYGLTATPTGAVQTTMSTMPVFWSLYTCDPFGCTYSSGTSTFTVTMSSAPADLRFQSYHGNGTVSWGSSVCAANCPPSGASYYVPSNSSNLNGNVVSSQDAGSLNMSGPPPTIQ